MRLKTNLTLFSCRWTKIKMILMIIFKRCHGKQSLHRVGHYFLKQCQSFDPFQIQIKCFFVDRTRSNTLKDKFNVKSIPHLVVLSADGKVLTDHGRDDIDHKGVEAIQFWSRGEQVSAS